jgi:NitT/TauT family transport system permease protein
VTAAAGSSAESFNRRALDTALLLAVMLAAWTALHLVAGDVALPSPVATFRRAWTLLVANMFWGHVGATMWAYAIALVIAIGGGLLLGLVLGSNRLMGEVFEPALMAFYTVPKVAFFPIILLLFGIGLSAQVTFGVIHGIVPVAIFTMNAVRNVKPVFMKTARIMRLSPAQVWWKIVLPSSLPEIFTGIRIGVALTFIGTILSEMFGSHSGVGFLLMNAIGSNNGELILALTFLIILFAVLSSAGLVAVDRRLHARI